MSAHRLDENIENIVARSSRSRSLQPLRSHVALFQVSTLAYVTQFQCSERVKCICRMLLYGGERPRLSLSCEECSLPCAQCPRRPDTGRPNVLSSHYTRSRPDRSRFHQPRWGWSGGAGPVGLALRSPRRHGRLAGGSGDATADDDAVVIMITTPCVPSREMLPRTRHAARGTGAPRAIAARSTWRVLGRRRGGPPGAGEHARARAGPPASSAGGRRGRAGGARGARRGHARCAPGARSMRAARPC
jgi:hypothetical protein